MSFIVSSWRTLKRFEVALNLEAWESLLPVEVLSVDVEIAQFIVLCLEVSS